MPINLNSIFECPYPWALGEEHLHQYTRKFVNTSESFDGSGVYTPPRPLSNDSLYDYLLPRNRITKSHRRLQTLTERSNLLVKDKNKNHFAQTLSK